MYKLLTILLSLSLSSLCATAATIHVPANQPTIQAGINTAQDGDTVLVADGTYQGEGNRDIRLNGKAITVVSENGPENCIIDAAGYYTVFKLDRGESRLTIISGFTIINAYSYYGGIEIDSASPIIENCVIEGNDIGIRIRSAETRSYPVIERCLIQNNRYQGIYGWGTTRLIDSVIRLNGASGSNGDGGGIEVHGSLDAVNCLMEANNAGEDGGGLYCLGSYVTLINCSVVNNSADGYGGGFCADESSTVFMANCIFTGNSAGTGDQWAFLEWYYWPSDITVSYCTVVGDVYEEAWVDLGPGMIYEDPLFVSGPEGGFYLSQTAAGQGVDSPCVDTGDPDGRTIYGTTRTDRVVDDGIIDMGYHYTAPDAADLPDTRLLTGPGATGSHWNSSPAVVFTFTGSSTEHPASALTYSWRADEGDWSDWSPETCVIFSGLEHFDDLTFEVRARDPQGDVDPTPVSQWFYYHEPSSITLGNRYSWCVVGPGPGFGNPPLVRTSQGQWLAYGPMHYGVNVAAGDIDGDGVDEVVTGPGPGTMYGPHVRCFEADGQVVHNAGFMAYGTLRYGVNVAAGDVDGDGHDEIITGAGPGAVFGPHVRGWNWDGGPASAPIPGISYFAYGTLKYGVNVACGDIDGDGIDEIITGAGPGIVFGPHVRGWNFDGGSITPMEDVSYFAFDYARYGVTVACGDVTGDGRDDIITGSGPGPDFGPHVRGWKYAAEGVIPIYGLDFQPYPFGRYGVRVGVTNLDGGGRDIIITVPGPGPANWAWLRKWEYTGTGVEITDPVGGDFNAFDPWMTYGGNVAGARSGWEPPAAQPMSTASPTQQIDVVENSASVNK